MQIGQIISQTLFLWTLSTNYNFGADTPQLFTFCKLSSTSTTGWLAWLQNVKEQRLPNWIGASKTLHWYFELAYSYRNSIFNSPRDEEAVLGSRMWKKVFKKNFAHGIIRLSKHQSKVTLQWVFESWAVFIHPQFLLLASSLFNIA